MPLRIEQATRRWRRAIAARIAPPPTPAANAVGGRRAPRRPSVTSPRRTAPSHLDVLSQMHRLLEPRTYLEIGVSRGRSLALSTTRSIGVDPDFHVTVPIACDLQLVRATSDDFFAAGDAVAHFAGTPVDLAFIDGLHLAEFAYRDFMNVERLCSAGSVILLDDMLPRNDEQAARERTTRAWAGDVFKVADLLRRLRPDLTVLPVDTAPTGVVVVAGLDPSSTVLADAYGDVLAELQSPDPQHVPPHVVERHGAVDVETLAGMPTWAELRLLR